MTIAECNSGLPGLTALANAFSVHTGALVTASGIAYAIRQLNLSHGCRNNCSHCFADPPTTIKQMALDPFLKLSSELAQVAQQVREPFPFLYFGASTDPAMVHGFHRYVSGWIDSVGAYSHFKLFSHGWDLSLPRQRAEFDALCDTLAARHSWVYKIALSVDLFSSMARRDWQEYLHMVGGNLRGLLAVLPPGKLRLEVTFPVERLDLDEHSAVSQWLAKPSSEHMRPADGSAAERACCRLIEGVFAIGAHAGLDPSCALRLYRDAGIPFPAGRATALFDGRSSAELQSALENQTRHSLPSLTNSPFGTTGIGIMPDGRACLIELAGYRITDWLAEGQQVVPYLQPVGNEESNCHD